MRKTSIFLLALFVFIPTSYGLFSSLTVKQIDQIDSNTGTYFDINSTGAIKVPVGTVGEQPTGVNGMLRYSTTDNAFEGYVDGAWDAIGGGSGVVANMTDWLVGTCTSTWTTNTTTSCLYKQNGDSVDIQFKVDMTGAPDAVALKFNLPSEFGAYDASKLQEPVHQHLGDVYMWDGAAGKIGTARPDAGSIRVMAYTDNGSNEAITNVTNLIPSTFASGDTIVAFIRDLPITGLTSGTTAIVQQQVLRNVRARKTIAQELADNVAETIIYDDELEDGGNLYNSTTGVFTCPEAGARFSVGFNVYFQALDDNSNSLQTLDITNGTDSYNKIRNQGLVTGATDSNVSTDMFIFKCASNSETWEFRGLCNETDSSVCNTRANSGNTYFNSLSIRELSSAVNLAVGNRVCQRKILSADVTTNTTVNDFTYTNMEAGKTYTVGGQHRVSVGAGDGSAFVNVVSDAVTIGRCWFGNETATNGQAANCSYNFYFVSAGSDLTFVTTGFDNANTVLGGNATRQESYIEVCEEIIGETAAH